MSDTALQLRIFDFPGDYEQVRQLWESMDKGVRAGRSDTLEEIQKKLERDPDLFLVVEDDSKIIGTIICGRRFQARSRDRNNVVERGRVPPATEGLPQMLFDDHAGQ